MILTHFSLFYLPFQLLIQPQRKQLAVLAGKKEIEDMLLYQAAKDAELQKREDEEVHTYNPINTLTLCNTLCNTPCNTLCNTLYRWTSLLTHFHDSPYYLHPHDHPTTTCLCIYFLSVLWTNWKKNVKRNYWTRVNDHRVTPAKLMKFVLDEQRRRGNDVCGRRNEMMRLRRRKTLQNW